MRRCAELSQYGRSDGKSGRKARERQVRALHRYRSRLVRHGDAPGQHIRLTAVNGGLEDSMAFLHDSRPPREPFLVAPASVLWLIAVILGAHVLRGLLPPDVSDQILNDYAFVPARYSGMADFANDTFFA